MVEEMYSLEELIQIYGDPAPGESSGAHRVSMRCPVPSSKDMWGHQYDQQPNCGCLVSNAPRDWTTNGPKSNVFGLEPNFGCCTANMHQGWPKFAASLWMGTADNGIAAIVYSPSDVRTVLGGTPVHITEDTKFPFEESVAIKVDPEKPVSFPVRLAIPGWTSNVIVRVNGVAQRDCRGAGKVSHSQP